MGKKKLANKLPSTTGDKRSDSRATVEARPPCPQPSEPVPTPHIPAMVPLDALAAFLIQQDPNRDWEATLAGFGQTGGMPAIPTPTPEFPAAISPLTTIPTSSTPTSSNPSPIHPQIEPLGVSPLSAHQQIEEDEQKQIKEEEQKQIKEGEAKEIEEEKKENEEEKNEGEETLAENPITQEKEREEIDLNETARKQGLMTDEEFQSFLDGVNEMAEGLDLASQSVEEVEDEQTEEGATHQSVEEVKEKQTEEEMPKSVLPQSEAEGGDTETEEKEAKAQPEKPEPLVPSVSKPKAVKRRLILKNDPKAKVQKPRRVSQRCLGRWTSSKAGANTTPNAVEISSEDERTTPTKPGEESLTATGLEDTPMATEMVSPTLNDQEEETDEMAEGLDLASESVGHDVPIADTTMICVVTKPTAQKESSPATEEKPEVDEDRYLQ